MTYNLAMRAAVQPASIKFQAFLFGAMRLERNGKDCTLPASVVARSLLACLLFNRQTPQTRDTLLGIFWPEMSEERARRALSQALWHIRHAFPDLLDVNSETISISNGITLWVDTEAFERMITPALDAAPLDETARQNLEQALELFRADFLGDSYHDWALLERERLRELYLQTLERLGQLEKAAGRYAKALELALRLSRADPLNETAHREIMRLHQLLGQPEAASRQFEVCRQTLRQELDVAPEPETIALAEEISQRAEARSSAAESGKERGNLVPAPLVGREKDRAALLHFVEGIFNKLGGLVLVEGEAGVGKTRLLQEVARDAEWRGAQVLWGNTREAQGLKPYAPLVEALQAGLSPLRVTQIQQIVERVWLQAILPLLAPHPALPTLEPAPSLPPAQEQARLVEAVIRFLEGWQGIVPLVLILEDLHWAGHDTLDLLPTLARRLSPFGILMICSYRGEEARAHPQVWEALQVVSRGGMLERRVLSRLGEPATGELIRRSLGLASPAPLFEVRIHHETDGNPLFVLETLRALQDEGLLKREEGGNWSTPWDETTADYTELPLPPLVEKVITGRLELLPAKSRHLLDMLAVLGNRFDFGLLGAVSGLETPALLERTRELIRRAFLEETDSGYRFGHDKIHQVVYEGIEAGKRVLLHRKIAVHLAKAHSLEPDALAYHFWRGEVWEQAALYNQRAAEAAMSLHANQEARTYLSRALDALDRLPNQSKEAQRAGLLRTRETVNGLLGDRAAQKADLEELNRVLDDPAARSDLTLRLAEYHEATSDYPAAVESARRALELARELQRTDLAIAARLVWARVLTLQALIESARDLLAGALGLARACGDRFNEARCLYLIGTTYYEQSRFVETLEYCQNALQIFQALGNRENEANCLSTLASALTDIGKVQTGIEHMEKVLRIRRALGDRRGEAQAQYSLAIKHHFARDDETSLRYCREMTATAQAIADLRLEAYGCTYLGLLLEKSDPQQAYQQYSRSLEIRQRIGQPAMQVDSRAGLARAMFEMGRIPEAVKHIAEALAWVDKNGTDCVGDMWLVYLTGYRVFTTARKEDEAAQCIETAHAYLEEELASMPDDASREALVKNLPELREVKETYRAFQIQRHGIQRPFRLLRAGQTDDWVTITWTLNAPEDDCIADKVTRRHHRLSRLLREAAQQEGVPTYQHLAEALGVGLRTIERDMAELKKKGIVM